jgi:hypothetical protein
MLEDLELGERPAEGDAGARVVGGEVEHGLHRARHLRRPRQRPEPKETVAIDAGRKCAARDRHGVDPDRIARLAGERATALDPRPRRLDQRDTLIHDDDEGPGVAAPGRRGEQRVDAPAMKLGAVAGFDRPQDERPYGRDQSRIREQPPR